MGSYLVPAIPDFLSTVGISLIKLRMDEFNDQFRSMCSYAGVTQPYVDTKFAGIVFNMGDRLREPNWRFTLCTAHSMPSNNAKRLLSCCFAVTEHL
jgi:hypothetical protein